MIINTSKPPVVLPIENGGTGATNSSDAIINLGITPETIKALSLEGGIVIPENTNLDNYNEPGNYYCETNDKAITLLNTPTATAFKMSVRFGNGVNYPTQTIYDFLSGKVYERYQNIDSTWSNWKRAYQTDDVIPVGNGGTGMIITPSMLVNLSSETPSKIYSESPTPGVTGILPISHGGTGAISASEALANLGLPYEIGTWTPIFGYVVETTPATVTTPTAWDYARYTRIGRLVYIHLHWTGFSITDPGSGEYAVIRGLPFPVAQATQLQLLGHNWPQIIEPVSNDTSSTHWMGQFLPQIHSGCFAMVDSTWDVFKWKAGTVGSTGRFILSGWYVIN